MVDPDVAMRVAGREGLRTFLGDHGKSGGAFHLFTGGGLGNQFQKETGLNPLDPKNERATIAWAMRNAGRTKSWEPYHGARRAGVGVHEGFDYHGNVPPEDRQASRKSLLGFEAGRGVSAASRAPEGQIPAVGGEPAKAFIVHHTGGGSSIQDTENTLRHRGLGVQYIMDREGNIRQTGGPGEHQIRKGRGEGAGLSNRNTVGMEVIARDDRDVTPAQIAAAKAFVQKNYPNTPVFGHGEVNPGHKQASEGRTIAEAIRAARAAKTP